jgi:two-component system, NtrC family, sensor kinase
MLENKQEMIQLLTGVKSSKRNYYTELKKTISELQKKNMQLEIIGDVMKNMKVDMSIESILENVLMKLKKIIEFDRLGIALYQKSQLTLANVYPTNSFHLKTGAVIPRENSLFWKVVKRKRMAYYSLSSTEKELTLIERHVLQELKIDSLLLLPLLSKSQVIGVLCFGSQESLLWEDSDLDFLTQLSDYLAVSIENSHLYNEVLLGKKEWEDTFEAVVDVLFVVDENHRIMRYNEAAKKFLKVNGQEFIGKMGCRILSCMEENCDCLIAESFASQKMASRQISIKNDRICEVYTYPMFNDENIMYGVIVYMKDVTERLEIEAQLMHSGKLAAIGEMAAGVAHELNSPLTAILGNSQLLMREVPKDDPSYKLLEDIKTCGNRCKNIIRSLLTFSRQDQYIFEECSVNQAVNQVLNLIRYQIERGNIEIELKLDLDLPVIETSIQHIEQIVINLLLNAKDALEESDQPVKKIIIETGRQTIEENEWIFLSVIDNGIGMEEGIIKEAFHPFFTTKEAVKGTGLGLSVSLGIAKAHGGTINIMSKPEEGSTFQLLLPVPNQETTL